MIRTQTASSARRSRPRRRLPRPPTCGATFDDLICREWGDHFCEPRARRVEAIFDELLVHTKGRYARQRFQLRDWQRNEIIRPIFGTIVWDDELSCYRRRYRVVWIELGRKNGKSELLAAIVLILLVADDEESAEVYGCAKDREQAGRVFRVVMRMVRLSPKLRKRLGPGIREANKRIIDHKTASVYQVIAADAAGELGQDPSGIVFDEVVAQPNDKLWDALKTGMGSASRSQPMMVAATTAGDDPSSFAAVQHEFAEKVAEDPAIAPDWFVYMRNTPKDADPWDERNWYHANPALGDFLRLSALRADAKEAKENPRAENAFRWSRLNQWVQQAERWLPMHVYDAGAGMVVESKLRGRQCWGGVDLASTQDVNAICWLFPDWPAVDAVWRFFVPEARIADLDKRTGGRASVWVREGWLQTTEGNVTDYGAIETQIRKDGRTFRVRELGYDPWNAGDLVGRLADAPFELVEVGQWLRNISPAAKAWERLVMGRLFRHGANPVMAWMVDNVVARTDANQNIAPDRKRSRDKIDGVVAAIMALSRATAGGGRPKSKTLRAG